MSRWGSWSRNCGRCCAAASNTTCANTVHDHPRHPRPDGGQRARRPHRGDGGRRAAAICDAGRTQGATGQPVHRHLHRRAAYERFRGDAEARREPDRLRHRRGLALDYADSGVSEPARRPHRQLPKVVLGVRPHGLESAPARSPARCSCQWLGDQTHVAAEVDGRTAVSVSHSARVQQPGSNIASRRRR